MWIFYIVLFFGKKPQNFFKKSFPRMKVTLPSKVASKQASKILIERQMVLLRAWLPKLKKKKKVGKKRVMLLKLTAKLSDDYKYFCPTASANSASRADTAKILTSPHLIPRYSHPS